MDFQPILEASAIFCRQVRSTVEISSHSNFVMLDEALKLAMPLKERHIHVIRVFRTPEQGALR